MATSGSFETSKYGGVRVLNLIGGLIVKVHLEIILILVGIMLAQEVVLLGIIL